MTLAANNRFAVLPAYDRQAGVVTGAATKLRVLRGTVSTMGLLPFNQLMLIGVDTGAIALLA